MAEYRMTIQGQVPSKANSYKVAIINGHYSVTKAKAMKDYEQSFYWQCPYRGVDIKGMFKVEIDVYFRTLMSDLDNAAKGILDCLQSCKVIHNDNKCVELHMRKFKDENNPRAVIRIEKVEL